MSEGITVDGRRPAVEWVTSLPREYGLTPGERLVLMVLACDAFGWESAPGYDGLAQWTGMHRSSTAEIVACLCSGTSRRPALLARIESVRGRKRTVFRLLGPAEPSGYPGRLDTQPSGYPDRSAIPDGSGDNRPAIPDGSGPSTVAQPSGNRPAIPDAPLTLNPSTSPELVVTTPARKRATPARKRATAATERGTRIPDDWYPDQRLIDWCRENTPSVGSKDIEEFRNYWLARPGKDGRKVRWDLTFRNRAQELEDRRTGSTRTRIPSSRKPTMDDIIAESAIRYEEMRRAEQAADGGRNNEQLTLGGNL